VISLLLIPCALEVWGCLARWRFGMRRWSEATRMSQKQSILLGTVPCIDGVKAGKRWSGDGKR